MKIYTKSGDQGTTSLVNGSRVSKNHIRIEATGAVDELNSWIGLLAEYTIISDKKDILRSIQNRLFEIGSHLASEKILDKLPQIKLLHITHLEQEIDNMTSSLAPMKYFILPGGHKEVAFCHVARTVCRRAERNITTLHASHPLNENILAYINRLSDFLFTLCRYMCVKLEVDEISWIPENN
ncbi:MAG: cob(I)yrinic acid a,c-diamide adenosyltransferase [Cytophagales bacterium]|nr:cob(I)yrinic acid a,c-diamide adenosyltransferase [Cytophagales bacterium]